MVGNTKLSGAAGHVPFRWAFGDVAFTIWRNMEKSSLFSKKFMGVWHPSALVSPAFLGDGLVTACRVPNTGSFRNRLPEANTQ